jgi:hypothetical protein
MKLHLQVQRRYHLARYRPGKDLTAAIYLSLPFTLPAKPCPPPAPYLLSSHKFGGVHVHQVKTKNKHKSDPAKNIVNVLVRAVS